MRVKALVAVTLGVLASAGVAPAVAQEQRGIDPNQGRSLVEVTLDSKAAAMRLQLEAESYGVEFNDHYLRTNGNGTVTATVFASEVELDKLAAAGFDLGTTIEGPKTWEARIEARQAEVRQEKRADAAALSDVGVLSHEDEIVVLRVDYFENYAGRFLSVEAKNRQGGAAPSGSVYVGPEMSLTYNRGGDTSPDSTPRLMNVNIDPDTTPDTYIEHRELVRIGDVGTSDPPAPTRIRIGSSTGAAKEAPVNVWLGGGLPPIGDGNYLKDFTTRYMDPTEVYSALPRAPGRVPEYQRADHAAAQDQRLPAPRAGDSCPAAFGTGQHAATRGWARRARSSSPRARGAMRAATTSRPSSGTRWRPTRR